MYPVELETTDTTEALITTQFLVLHESIRIGLELNFTSKKMFLAFQFEKFSFLCTYIPKAHAYGFSMSKMTGATIKKNLFNIFLSNVCIVMELSVCLQFLVFDCLFCVLPLSHSFYWRTYSFCCLVVMCTHVTYYTFSFCILFV